MKLDYTPKEKLSYVVAKHKVIDRMRIDGTFYKIMAFSKGYIEMWLDKNRQPLISWMLQHYLCDKGYYAFLLDKKRIFEIYF